MMALPFVTINHQLYRCRAAARYNVHVTTAPALHLVPFPLHPFLVAACLESQSKHQGPAIMLEADTNCIMRAVQCHWQQSDYCCC
jgi:hypothetical protein